MRIIVCVKQVPAITNVKMNFETNTLIREGVESVINPYDTYAIEEALRLKHRFGAIVVTISMGIRSTEEILKETIALGADEAYLLSDRVFAGSDTLATAYALSKGVEKIGSADLIICGKMATDGDTAQVGPMLGEILDIPHVTDISSIDEIGDGYIICKKMSDDGYIQAKILTPGLITVTKEINTPRLPSITGMLKGHNWNVPVWNCQDIEADPNRIGLASSPTNVVKSFIPKQERGCQWLDGDMKQKALSVMSMLVERKLI